MKITRTTRYCCIAVIMAGISVVGHMVAKDRAMTPDRDAEKQHAQER